LTGLVGNLEQASAAPSLPGGRVPVEIAVGRYHSLVLANDGTVWAWGRNNYGQLGDGTTANRSAPVQVHGYYNAGYLEGVIAISAGYDHSLALKSDGTVWTWGYNYRYQLGNGSGANSSTPVRVVGGSSNTTYLNNIIAISAGEMFSIALKRDGTVWAWGENHGKLGDGSGTIRTTPVQVVGGSSNTTYLNNIIAISACYQQSFAIRDDHTLWAWGCNGNGQLGDGTTTDRYAPVQVKGENGIGFLEDVVAISAGNYSQLAVKSDGTVWAWGYNSRGQLGGRYYYR